MPEKKPSNADLVVQVVREAPEPLPFAEILERVNALVPITTRNPKNTIDPLVASLLEQIGKPPRRRRPQKASASLPAAPHIYQLKITLEDTRPPIWRCIQAPGDLTLPQLHAVLQIAMGWTNSHLHGFRVGEQFYTEPDPDYADMAVVDERQFRLNQIAPQVGARFIYEYDFGDSWEHALVVEQILPPDLDASYPRCVAGKRACPPEDVGGVYGYAEFLAAIRNRRHPEHSDWLEWIGGAFDPEAFDLQKVNELLQAFYTRLVESS